MKLKSPGSKPTNVGPVRASAGAEAWLRKKIQAMVKQMNTSVLYWVKASWNKTDLPYDQEDVRKLAQDRNPVKEMQAVMEKLAKQWNNNFDDMATFIAQGFADKTLKHGTQAFEDALRKAGFSVRFQTTPAINDALDAQMFENISLIKSIPAQYLKDIHVRVMQSVAAGRSLKQLTKDLQEVYGVTHRRAALIARDQNNKATAIIHKTRQKEVGISKARWVHTSASKHPRPEHKHWGDKGAIYDINEGMWSEVDGQYVWPGTPINCGCTSMSLVPGVDYEDDED